MQGNARSKEKVFVTYLSLCLRLMLERLERADNDPLNTPRVLERLNSLVLYRHETDDKPKLYWQEIPKRGPSVDGTLENKNSLPDICYLEAGIQVLFHKGAVNPLHLN